VRKSLAFLLAAAMMLFSLTACGNRDKVDQNGTAGQNDSAVIGGDSAGSQNNSAAQNGTNNPTDSTHQPSAGDDHNTNTGNSNSLPEDAENAIQNGIHNAEDAVNKATNGVSYERMLNNGRVHDRDGDLTDLENSVTPGSTSF